MKMPKKEFYKEVDPFKLKEGFVYTDKLSPLIKDVEDNIDNLPRKWNNFLGTMIRNSKIRKLRRSVRDAKSFNERNRLVYDGRAMKMLVRKSINLVRKKSMLDMAGWKREWNDRKKPGKTFMVNMELRNGFHTHFFVLLEHKYFDYEDGRYLIDDSFKYYNVATKIYCLDYHQDICIPLKRKIDVNGIQKKLMDNNEIETETSIDPKSLKIFIESDIIQKAMKGAEMDEWIRFIKSMLIIITVICGAILLGILKIMFTK